MSLGKAGVIHTPSSFGGYSTISLGYAGLYECVKYMTGKSHTDPSATPFALEIMEGGQVLELGLELQLVKGVDLLRHMDVVGVCNIALVVDALHNAEAALEAWKCPKCGNTDQDKMNVARRTCGYIGTQYWNQGRTQEIRDRVLHL